MKDASYTHHHSNIWKYDKKSLEAKRRDEEMSLGSVYQEHGYTDRQDYLQCLAEDLGIDLDVVLTIASLLGENEDFDGLVTTLEDYGM